MTWKSPIKAIDIECLANLCMMNFLDEYGIIWYKTVLLKQRGKVIAVCSLELLDHSGGGFMCAWEEFIYGLKVKKIRRPKLFEKYTGKNVAIGEVVKEFRNMQIF